MSAPHAPVATNVALEAFRASIASLRELTTSLDGHGPDSFDLDAPGYDLTPLDDDAPDTDDQADAGEHTSLLAALDALQAELHQAGEVLDHLDDSTSALDQLAPLLSQLAHAANHAHDTVDELHHRQQSLVDGASTLAASIVDRHATDTSEALNGALHLVSDQLTHDFDVAVDGLHDNARNHLNDFLSHSTESSNALTALWLTLLRDAAHEIGTTLTEELKSGFHDAVNQGVKILAKEVTAAGAKMALGEATTSTLAPAIPYLVAAKKALEFINWLLGR